PRIIRLHRPRPSPAPPPALPAPPAPPPPGPPHPQAGPPPGRPRAAPRRGDPLSPHRNTRRAVGQRETSQAAGQRHRAWTGRGGWRRGALPRERQVQAGDGEPCSERYPPRSLRVVRRLTAPGGSLTRPRQLSSGPAPAIPPLLLGRHGRPTSGPPPSASRGCPYTVPLAMAASGTPARVCTRLSLHDSAQQEPSVAPPALQELF